jgi:serine/threonine-protein kinase
LTLEAGSRLGPYEVIGPLGKGGMGEVYRARDSQLGRDVAIKVLPTDVAHDPDRLQRFEREAKALATLNHANVATLHGMESAPAAEPGAAETPFLVMELVEGETLGDRIQRGPLPVPEAITLFLQIARGLEAAHAKGVVHRDLKPANIAIAADATSTEGIVKILDFGLAKATTPPEATSGAPSLSLSPTLTMAATQRGEILGTAAYMSPEQAKGKEVDRRTDVWAFGACLLEALTGKSAFAGDDASEVLGAVMLLEPQWDALPDDTPYLLKRLMRRCLEKDPTRRLHDIGDVRLDLEEVLEGAEVPAAPESVGAAPRSSVSKPLVAAVVLLAALSAGIATWLLKPEPPREVVRSVLTTAGSPPVNLHLFLPDVAVSPDGSTVVYTSGSGLWVRDIHQLGGRQLAGAEGGSQPFFSPDGEWVGFYDQQRSLIRKVSVLGGPAVNVSTTSGFVAGIDWGDNDTIVFTLGGGAVDLYTVSAAGGDPVEISIEVPEGVQDVRWPQWLPGSEALLLTLIGGSSAEQAVNAVLEMPSRTLTPLIRGGSYARYSLTGHIVYGLEGTLRAAPFDLATRAVQGNPLPVLEDVVSKAGSLSTNFALSSQGSLVYVRGRAEGLVPETLSWIDEQGEAVPIYGEKSAWQYPAISPDGTKVAISSVAEDQDIWVWEFARETLTRLTFDSASEMYPRWSPDSQYVYFSSSRLNGLDIFRRAADGTGSAEPILTTDRDQIPYSVSPDGKLLVYRDGSGTPDLGIVALDGESEGRPLLATEFSELNAEISPDGRWIAYESDQSGLGEIYVRPFPDIESGRWQVSNGGGSHPLWAPDGSALHYRASIEGRFMTASVEADESFRAGTPRLLFETSAKAGIGRTWAVHPDGKRFLVISREAPGVLGDSDGAELVLVQNWASELERLVPSD